MKLRRWHNDLTLVRFGAEIRDGSVNSSILVYCVGDKQQHEERVWAAAVFVRTEDAPDGWELSTHLGNLPLAKWRVRKYLDGDTYLSPEDRRTRALEVEPTRSRIDLRCGVCDLSASIRSERLYPILDRLELAGVSEVSIAGLAGRLNAT